MATLKIPYIHVSKHSWITCTWLKALLEQLKETSCPCPFMTLSSVLTNKD